jgi:uncharacterized membrane protein
MGELAVVVYDDRPAADGFLTRLTDLHARGSLHIRGLAVVRRRLDDRLTLDRTSPKDQSGFWGLLVGLVLWPIWLGAEITPALASTLDDWGITPAWADTVAHNIEPGNVAVLFFADHLPAPLLDAIRTTEGDLFHLPLSGHMHARLVEAFGGHTGEDAAQPGSHPG